MLPEASATMNKLHGYHTSSLKNQTKQMSFLFTSESVSEGHPDKVCDHIADAVLDQFLAFDPASRVACEVMVTRGLTVLAGEVSSKAYVDIDTTVRNIIRKIGYTQSDYGFDADGCGILTAIHEQSPDIARGVIKEKPEEQGAGDQGLMFGYACNETPNFMPLTSDISNTILRILAELRKSGTIPYLRPDAKSQVTIEYSDRLKPVKVHTIVISTQHDPFVVPKDDSHEEQLKADEQMRMKIQEDIEKIVLPKVFEAYGKEYEYLFNQGFELLVNKTGKFVIGGPAGDTGVTGRKIIVDTYGGRSGHGGGAFSGKDPSKVDRSAAYAARHIAKNMVAAGVADEVSVQLAYVISGKKPISIYVDTFGTAHTTLSDGEMAEILKNNFDLSPSNIEKSLKLRAPIYEETAAYGHFGRVNETVTKHFKAIDGSDLDVEVELFTWEKLDLVDKMKTLFGL